MRRILLLFGVGLMAFGLSGGSAGGTIPPFNPSVTVDATTTFGSGGSPQDWWGRASIKRRADGVLLCAYKRGSIHYVNDGALHIKFSDDDGATWTAEDTKLGGGAVGGFPMNPSTVTAGEDAGEPWLYVAPNGDILLHMWRVDYGVTANGTYQSRSTDGGENWSTSAQVDFGIAGVSNGNVFATDDDFVWDRVIYAGARVYTGGVDGVPTQSILIKSDDDGVSWSKVSTIMDNTEGQAGSEGASEVGLEYLGHNRIIAMLRDHPHLKSYQRYSYDMGATWATLMDVTSTVGIAGRQRVYTVNHLKGLPGWWWDPRLVMVGFVHQDPGNPDSTSRRNAIWISPDRGATWPGGPHYLQATTEDGGYGDMFYDAGNDQYVVINYAGLQTDADLYQYNLTLPGIH
jgi:hypothetical protein